jgi:hypothetical protein
VFRDWSLSESNNKAYRFSNFSTSQIDVVRLVKQQSKDQSRLVSLELETLNLENVQKSQVNQDRVVLGTNSEYFGLPRHSHVKYSLLTVNGLINGNLVTALIYSGFEVECVLGFQLTDRAGIAFRPSTLRDERCDGSLIDLEVPTQTVTLNLDGHLDVKVDALWY